MQRDLERTYAIDAGPPVERFLIDRATFEEFRPPELSADYVAEETLLVRECANDEMEMALFLDEGAVDAVADTLQRRGRFDGDAMRALCLVTEGVSHFVFVAWRAGQSLAVTQLELEMQAEVDKYLACLRAMTSFGLMPSGADTERLADALGRRLFDDWRLAEGLDATQRERYTVASRMAQRYCRYLTAAFLAGRELPRLDALVAELRRFYRMGPQDKLRHINTRRDRAA